MSQLFVQYVTRTMTDTNDNDPLLNFAFVQGWCLGRGIFVPKDIWRLLEADIKKYNLEAKGCWEQFKMNPIYFIDYWYHNKWQQKHNPLHVVMPGLSTIEKFSKPSSFVLLPLVIECGTHPLRRSNKTHWGYVTSAQSGISISKFTDDLFLGFRFKERVDSWSLSIKSPKKNEGVVTVAEYNNMSPELNNISINVLTNKTNGICFNEGIGSLDFYNPDLWESQSKTFYYISGLFPLCKLAAPFTEIIIETNVPTEIELLATVLDTKERRGLATTSYPTPNRMLLYKDGCLQKNNDHTISGEIRYDGFDEYTRYSMPMDYQQGVDSINEYLESIRNPNHFQKIIPPEGEKTMYLPPHLTKK